MKKISRRNFLQSASATAAVAGLTACGASGSTVSSTSVSSTQSADSTAVQEVAEIPTELDLYTYYDASSLTVIDMVLEELKVIYPDLTINIEHRTDADGSVLITRAAVGELPDIMELTGQVSSVFRESGDILSLTEVMEESDIYSKFYDGTLDDLVDVDGNYYAITATAPEPFLVYYNTEVFDECGLKAPENYEEFKEVVTTLKANGVIPLALFAQQRWPGLQLFDLAVISQGQYGGVTALYEGTAKITDPEYLEAAKRVVELVNLGLVGNGAFSTNASQAIELIGSNAAGMGSNGSWFFDVAVTNGFDHKMSYCPYNPFADAADAAEVQYHMSGGTRSAGGYGVSSATKNPEFAKEVLMHFVEQRAIAMAKIGSVNVHVDDIQPLTAKSEAATAYADSLKNFESTTYMCSNIGDQEFVEVMKDSSALLYTGSTSAEDFIAQVESSLNAIGYNQ